jgi:hypothetical protein
MEGLNMIIDATKINYFKDPEKAADEYKTKSGRKTKGFKNESEEEVGVIIDASMKSNAKKRKAL